MIAECHDLFVDELDRADVHATGGLADQQKLGVLLDLTRDDDLLLVPAREILGRKPGDRGAHVELFHLAAGVFAHRLVVHEKRVLLVFRLIEIAEGHILPGAEIQNQAIVVPVFGHMSDAGPAAALPVRPLARQGQVGILQSDLSGGTHHAAQRGQKFRLPVARHPGDAKDLARADLEADTLQAFDLVFVAHPQILHPQHHGAGRRRFLFHFKQDLAAHHQLGQRLGAGLAGLDRGNHRPAPHDRHVVGRLHDLAQFVGDQDDCLALIAQAAKDAEQVVRLGGGQDAGGFVQDQDIGLTIQGLENLDPLLVTDRQVLDQRIGVHVQLVVAA